MAVGKFMDNGSRLILYFFVKYFAYTFWCAVGIGLLSRNQDSIAKRAAGLGLVRLLMGVFLGYVVIALLLLSFGLSVENDLLAYLLTYVPVRIFEWLVMVFIICKEPAARLKQRATWWIVGGIVISCLADLIMTGGASPVPRGRFLC